MRSMVDGQTFGANVNSGGVLGANLVVSDVACPAVEAPADRCSTTVCGVLTVRNVV